MVKEISVIKESNIRKPKLLIVEGNHERDFFTKWLEILNKDNIQVMPIGGKTRFKDTFVELVQQPEILNVISILIIRDADDDPSSAFQSVCDALKSDRATKFLEDIGVTLQLPKSAWTFTQNTTPRVGIAILPAKDQIGALEELLLQTIDDDPMSRKSHLFIGDAIETLNNSGHRCPPPHRVGKAKIHAFLATFEYPDRDQGKSALAGVWDFQHESLDPLRAILEEL